MAPPEKDVMGARVHIDTDPPGEGEPNPPRMRPKQRSKPDVEMEPESETQEHFSKVPRSHSPGGIKLEGPGGWRMTIPHAIVIAVLAGGAATAGTAKVITDRQSETKDTLSNEARNEIKLLRKEMADMREDVLAVRNNQVDERANNKKLANYTEDSIAPIVASLRKMRVKLEFTDDAEDKAKDIEFHPVPLNPNSPQIQPKALLPAKPQL